MRDLFDDEDDIRPRRNRSGGYEFDVPRRASFWSRLFGRNLGDRLAVGACLFVGAGIAANALLAQSGPHPAPLFAARADAVPVTPVPARAPEVQSTASITPRTVEAPAAPPARPRQELVADIQRELARLGLYDGAVDGLAGPKTEAGIRRYEAQAGLRATGEPTEQLLAQMRRPATRAAPAAPQSIAQLIAQDGRAPVPAPRAPQSIAQLIEAQPTARPTAAGERRLVAVRRALAKAGYPVAANAGAGSDMREAIQRFERDRRLPVTGQVSERLVRELASVTGTAIQ